MSMRAVGRLAARCGRARGVAPAQLLLREVPATLEVHAAASPWEQQLHSGSTQRLYSCRWSARQLHGSAAAFAVEEVLVPSMGDSITEGTIVNVSKAAGDAVAEDEVIAQIETDKVTIDVRAPRAGTLTDILVKDDDNVEVGQSVARIDTEGGGGSGSSAAAGPTPPKQEAKASPAAKIGGEPTKAERPQPGGKPDERAGADAAAKGHTASLHFPPRRTADGQRISDLPAAESARLLAELTGGSAASQGAEEQQQQQPAAAAQRTAEQDAASEMEGVRLRRWAVGSPLPMDEDWQPAPGKWALSERELEMIELGGAEP